MARDDALPQFDGKDSSTEDVIAKVVVQLGFCPECKIKYAIIPDPRFPQGAQYHFCECTTSLSYTHICSGGFMCLKGHTLTLKDGLFVYGGNLKWIRVGQLRGQNAG